MANRVKFTVHKYGSASPVTVQVGDAVIKYIPNFLSSQEQTELYEALLEEVPWEQGIYTMFGKPIPTPRLLSAMGDETDTRYKVTDIAPWSDRLRALKENIEEDQDVTILYSQLNYYRNGDDYIGWHADKEVQVGDSIYSISLGATRRFILRAKNYRENPVKYEFSLKGGSLIIMNRAASTVDFKHCVPKESTVTDGRVNITFRNR